MRMMNAAINCGIPEFFFWIKGAGKKLQLQIAELRTEARTLPFDYFDDVVKRRLYQTPPLPWEHLEPIAERAERVCERLNRSTYAVSAAARIRGGIPKLFKQCWEEDEREHTRDYR